MGDNESQGNNNIKQESPESPCSKNKSNKNGNTSSKEQDRFLPIANVGRIMKKKIPANGKISKDAKETVQECVSEFISFVTGEASDKCQREKRKTINGDDIIWAITTLGFEDYVNPLKIYLNKYREMEDEKLNVPKQQRSNDQLRQLPQQQQQQQQQQRLLLHQQQQHDQFQQVDQGLSPYATNSLYSSNNTLLLPPQTSFHSSEQTFPLPFSPNSLPNNYQQQEQIDSTEQW